MSETVTHRIKVTKNDIEVAEQNDPHACMVWRAVVRELGLVQNEHISVLVDYDSIDIEGLSYDPISIEHPDGVSEKIQDWDEDKSLVDPFEFDINLPADWREQVMIGSAQG